MTLVVALEKQARQADGERRMDALSQLLSPLTWDEFKDSYFSKSAVRIEGSSDKFSSVFNWAVLNRILNSTPSPHPSSRLFKDGYGAIYPKSTVEVINHLQDGATFILDDADRYDTRLGAFLDDLTNRLGEATRFNAYASYPSRPGFGLHFDTHDVFILQAEGYKRWEVYPQTVESPIFDRKHHDARRPKEEELYLECVLEPGDVLYVPKGHWHQAISEREPSLHLTLAVFVKSGIDFMTWLTNELREEELFRRSFPISCRKEGAISTNVTPEVRDHLTSLRDRLDEMLSDEDGIYRNFECHLIAKEKNRHPFNFPYHILPHPLNAVDSEILVGPHVSVICRRNGDTVEVVVSDRLISFAGKAEKLVHRLFTEKLIHVADVKRDFAHLGDAAIDAVLNRLLAEGLLRPRPEAIASH